MRRRNRAGDAGCGTSQPWGSRWILPQTNRATDAEPARPKAALECGSLLPLCLAEACFGGRRSVARAGERTHAAFRERQDAPDGGWGACRMRVYGIDTARPGAYICLVLSEEALRTSLRTSGRCVLVALISSGMLTLPIRAAEDTPFGIVALADQAHVGTALASTGATVYTGDSVDTSVGGALRLRVGTGQLYLLSASAANLSQDGSCLAGKRAPWHGGLFLSDGARI